ncbi:MAG: hypothetical protein RBG13Loki_3737 [Promethearchaeota archaeon CR_4]|nr:MAG: hypothetical protein RBG13Loki_3737 [Candidatus Lokiarchaeota archaeon CR_4]
MRGILFIYNDISFFNEILDTKFDYNIELLSGFLGAIDSFAKEVSNSGIETLELGESRLIFMRVPLKTDNQNETPILKIISIVSKQEDNKKVSMLLERIKHAFFEIYSPSDVTQWDGNVLRFNPFKRVLHKILEQDTQQKDEKLIQELAELKSSGDMFQEGFSFVIMSPEANALNRINLGINEEHTKVLYEKIKSDFLEHFRVNKGRPEDLTWEILVPLVKENKFVYVVVKPLVGLKVQGTEVNNQVLFALFCYYIDGQNQIYFPKIIPTFNAKVQKVYEALTTTNFESFDKIFELIEGNFKNYSIFKGVSGDLETPTPNLDRILKGKFKDFDHLMYALMVGYPVAIIGAPQETKQFANDILVFCPHRLLRIQNHPDKIQSIDAVDLVTIDPKMVKFYGDFILLDLQKGSVKGGKDCKFCEQIWKKIQELKDPSLIHTYLKRQMNWILSKVSMIRNLGWGEKFDPAEIKAIRGDLDKDAEDFVLELVQGRGTILQNIVDKMSVQIPISKLLLDRNFIQFNDKKILVSSNLTTEQIQDYVTKFVKIGGMLLGPRLMEAIIKG